MKEFIEKLISKLEKTQEKYQELSNSSNFDGWYQEDIKYTAKSEMCEEIIENINQLTKEYNNGWIPCNERLPEEWEYIYITGSIKNKSSYKNIFGKPESTDCFYGYYHDGKFYGYTEEGVFWLLNAKAWQPLPEQYKEGDIE